jgi:hypothetical protein
MSFSFLLRFPDDESCWSFLECLLWPRGPVCPKCGSVGDATPWKPRPHRWQCRRCGNQFHVAQQTALLKSRVPMHRWFNVISLMAECPRISASELARQLGLRQKTAGSMRRRIIKRLMIEDAGLLEKIIEAAAGTEYSTEAPREKVRRRPKSVIPAKPRAAAGIRLAVRGSGRVPTVAERQDARGP